MLRAFETISGGTGGGTAFYIVVHSRSFVESCSVHCAQLRADLTSVSHCSVGLDQHVERREVKRSEIE